MIQWKMPLKRRVYSPRYTNQKSEKFFWLPASIDVSTADVHRCWQPLLSNSQESRWCRYDNNIVQLISSTGVRHLLGGGLSPLQQNVAQPPQWNTVVKNQEVNCAKFSNYDRFCSQNVPTMSANYFKIWFVPLTGASSLDPIGGLLFPRLPICYTPTPQWKFLVPPLLNSCSYLRQLLEPFVKRAFFAGSILTTNLERSVIPQSRFRRCVRRVAAASFSLR